MASPALPELTSLDGKDVQRFRGGLVFQAHRLCVSLNSRLEGNKEEEKGAPGVLLLLNNLFIKSCEQVLTQGYLAHKKQRRRRTLQ